MPHGQVWPEVQAVCAWFVAKKRVPDGFGHRAFFLAQIGCYQKGLHTGKTACFQRGGNVISAI